MGLDMYMSKRTSVKNWSFTPEDKQVTITIKRGGEPVDKDFVDVNNISEVVEDVAYWRKANAIHQWFVKNVQEGEDDCKEYYVDRDDIEKLVNICERVVEASKLVKGKVVNGQHLGENGEWVNNYEDGMLIEDPTVAKELLPTQEGFFFGSTDYNEWYLDDIKDTLKQLKPLVEKGEDGRYKVAGDLYYRASW